MKRAVVICPGRGTYNKPELGTLAGNHADKADLFDGFDEIRRSAGQPTLRELDGAGRFSSALHSRGDNASALIFAASHADFISLQNIEVVAVTGNSMGWYTALTCAGALSPVDGFNLANTMGTLMQEAMIGGQLVYPVMGEDWVPHPQRRSELLRIVDEIGNHPDKELALSIDLGGMLVIAGNENGLKAFENAVPKMDRFPMRLAKHAAFHTPLQEPVSKQGMANLSADMFGQPQLPLIDGRGAIWWPHSTDIRDLWNYTLDHQVTRTYDFVAAIKVAAREFAPDYFVVTGPGTTLGGAVAQSLIETGWLGMASRADFQKMQRASQLLVSMGREDQRSLVV